jgi:hypothetical protein
MSELAQKIVDAAGRSEPLEVTAAFDTLVKEKAMDLLQARSQEMSRTIFHDNPETPTDGE